MRYLKRFGKILTKLLKAVLLTLVLYLVAACIGAFVIVGGDANPAPKTHTVFVASNGVHANLIVPTNTDVVDWATLLKRPDLVNLPYTYVGWGSQAFYTQVPTWGDLTLKLTAKALLLDDSVVFIRGGYAPQTRYREIAVTTAQLQALTDDITAQMLSRTPLPNAPHFYRGKGNYSPLKTCNEWIRQRLANIGIATPIWSPFDRPILWALPK